MSIKKLFDKSRKDSRNFSDYSTDKETFDEVESSRNAESIQQEKRTSTNCYELICCYKFTHVFL